MGAANSNNKNLPSPPTTPLGAKNDDEFLRKFHFGDEHSDSLLEPRSNSDPQGCSSSNDNEPLSLGTSPYATFRREESWNQKPTAPTLPFNSRNPERVTLSRHAGQTTGWQTAGEDDYPSFKQQQYRRHRETMELSTRIISQLAMANHQLASAHNAALSHLDCLYVELRTGRTKRRRSISSTDAEAFDRKSEIEEKEERWKLEDRIARLENILTERANPRAEKFDSLDVDRTEDPSVDGTSPDHPLDRAKKSSDCRFPRRGCDHSDESRSDNVSRTRTVGRSSGVYRTNFERTTEDARTKSNRTEIEQEGDRAERLAKGEEEINGRLPEEIRRSETTERLEYRKANERLLVHLEDQTRLTKKLSEDYETSKQRYEKLEANFNEQRLRYDELTKDFDLAKKEADRTLKEIDVFHLEKNIAEERISSLERDLQRAIREKEEIQSTEQRNSQELEARLLEEVSDKKKQTKALQDALDEIQKLKEEIVKTDGNDNGDVASREDADSIESTDDARYEIACVDRATNMEEFKKELCLKREARQRAIAAVSSEMERLRRELDAEKEAHSETSKVLDLLRNARVDSQERGLSTNNNDSTNDKIVEKVKIDDRNSEENEMTSKRVEAQRLANILKISDELRNDIRSQMEKVDDLRYQLEGEPDQHRYRIRYLSEVTNKTREALISRERRANELKDHLAQISVRLGDRSFLDLKDDVGAECDRQIESINSLKTLYNERLKVLTELKDGATKELVDVKDKLNHYLKKAESLEEDLTKAGKKIDVQDTEISNLESQLGLTKADCRDLQNQMSLINGLFTQMLLGASSADMDLDRLTRLLQENHDLISDMAREESTEAAALPKLLLDLIEQVEGSKGAAQKQHGMEANDEGDGDAEKKEDDLQHEDIAHNLPKVWRVLFELLSCHAVSAPSPSMVSSSDPNTCYKSVDTPAGPRLVISVSKTYIRLKELILEKKHLEKEMNRMKQLNTHLESKLGEQEKRLSTVSDELSKTWNIVDRMQAQHQQLHTHEQILRYELQQKRKMLQELKQELEYCREKWESARQKNTNTEIEWRSLRREFAARKALTVHDSFSNSAESGFSDERGDDTDEEDKTVDDRIRIGPRRRTRKESPRAPTPDTESEQPTDTEFSEPKTGSSVVLEQRTSTPETETELDEVEIVDTEVSSEPINTDNSNFSENLQETMDPLDQALTSVIQNLIKMDDVTESSGDSLISRDNTVSSPENLNPEIAIEGTSRDTTREDTIASENLRKDRSMNNECDTLASKLLGSALFIGESFDRRSLKQDRHLTDFKEERSQETSFEDGEKASTSTEIITTTFVSESPRVTTNDTKDTLSIFSIGPYPVSIDSHSPTKNVEVIDPSINGRSNYPFTPVFGTLRDVATSTTSSVSSTISSTQPPAIMNQDYVKRSKSTENTVDSDNISVDSTSSLDTVKEFSTMDPTFLASCSSKNIAGSSSSQTERKVTSTATRTPEEALAARSGRLKRLEEQADWLMKKMDATNRRGSALSTRLEELHEVYGEPPPPPPMPNVLRGFRISTAMSDLPDQVPSISSSTNNDSSIEYDEDDEASMDA